MLSAWLCAGLLVPKHWGTQSLCWRAYRRCSITRTKLLEQRCARSIGFGKEKCCLWRSAYHSNETNKQATLLCQALYRYMGSTLVPLLSDLKEVQLKELQSKFDEMDSAGEGGKCKATRLTRKAQRMMESEAASSGPGGGGAAVEEEEGE